MPESSVSSVSSVEGDGSAQAEARSARRTMNARVGGRSERVVREVLRATLDELGRTTFVALRVEDVAARAGVNKTTVYRRWPTKVDLVAAAIRSTAHRAPLADTGTLRGDLVAELEQVIGFVKTAEGRAAARLVDTAGADPDVARLTSALRSSARARRKLIVERAQARGELPSGVDAALVLDAIFTPLIMRVLRYREELDPNVPATMVDLVLRGATNGGGTVAVSAG
jgi:AcrR family transcriptional regulator